MSGWIKLHRGLIDWEWYTDHNTCRLFIHCILRANFEDKVWRGIPINRGSFYTSLDTLSSETGLSNRQIRTSLDKLGMTGEVTSSGMARGRMITVVEYESYQQDDRLDVSEKAGKGQAGDRLVTTNKNLRTKEVKNIHIPFDSFWDIYPKKVGRADAEKKWNNLNPDDDIFTLINNHLSFAYLSTEKKFIPNATTYINQKRWNDEVIPNGQQDQSGENATSHRQTLPERVKAGINRQRAARGVPELDGEGMAEAPSDVRLQVHEPVRGATGQHVGQLLEGDYSETDS